VTILIVANGDIENVDWIRPYLSSATAVIAADGGTRHLRRLDHPPDVIIGDLDSLLSESRAWLEEAGVPMHVYPHDKNETDLELALLHAVSLYDRGDILIFGAQGGRLDQTLANILLLAHPALVGRRVELVEQYQKAWLVTDRTEIVGEVGDAVSLIPLGGDVLVRETAGLRWPLIDEVLAFGPARGVSNVMTETRASIIVGEGTLLCLHKTRSWLR
jgi:thiamine pyrophosphokinase